jgi:hypothetical protein
VIECRKTARVDADDDDIGFDLVRKQPRACVGCVEFKRLELAGGAQRGYKREHGQCNDPPAMAPREAH